jgi:hypothetical protein
MKKPGIDLKVIMILLGAFALLVRFLFSLNPYITETIYSRGIFGGIRFCFDYTIALLPIPLIYLLLALLIFFGVKGIVQWRKSRKKQPQKKFSFKIVLLKVLLFCTAVLGAVVFFFYFLWAFNYQRLPIETHLQIKPEPLGIEEIKQEAKFAFRMVARARENIPNVERLGGNALDNRYLPGDWEDKVRESLEKVLKSMDYPTAGRVRVKKLWSAGIMMNFGGSGLYLPFTGEAYIPVNLTAVEIPFAAAHEMAHGYGFSREGTANFLAYLACISSEDYFIQYSGSLVYFNHISGDLYSASPEEYKELRKKLPPGIIADKRKKYKNWEKYRGWLMDWGSKVYDSYLKTQGINEGMKSYDRLVVLTAAWRKAGK